ncbi:unnamed protein product [Paramecium pentaurelia]|uniref:Uncharacterized protein n=1 Tax=Paramecium pentaurelia TaxID=43138 RepID=A0A8S1U9F9_9CILI|nr:unnamed protein product [Paramecium pentaurelia]
MSHFARLVELLNESPKNQQNSELIQLVQILIQFQFPQHTYQMICNSFSLLIAKTGNEQIKQVVEALLQYINKKGSLKSIALNLLVTLIQLTKYEIQSFSYTLTQDITTTLMKLLKSSDYRILLCNVLYFLIESQKIEILKIALKFAQNEKLEILQQTGMQTLIYLMQEEVISEQMYLIAQKSDDSPLFYKYFSRYLFQQQNIVALTKKDKLKSQVQLQPREQAQKIFQLFDENLSKFPSNIVGNIFIAYKKYLLHEFKKLGLSIVRGSFEISFSYLGSMALDDPYLHTVYKKTVNLCLYMVQQVQLNERKDLLEYFFDKISKIKTQKWNVYNYKLLLKGINFLFDTLGSNVFDDKRSKPSEFIDILTPIFKINDIFQHPMSIDKPICISVSRNLFNTFESLFQENKKWQQSILSALLNYAKITLAEINVKETNQLLNQLRVQCALLSKLFSLLDLQLHSISSELINHLWETAKSFLNKSQQLRRTGWIIIAELLMVPYFGTTNKVKEIGILVEKNLTSKEDIKDEQQLLSYCSVGLVIISILNSNTLSKQIKDTTRKFFAQQTILMFNKLQQCKFDKQSPFVIASKYIFYQAIRQIIPKYYSNELNTLVQFCLEDIINGNSIWNQVNVHKNNHYVDELLGIPRSEFQLVLAASKFLGHIISSQSFTLKNKINFIRYVNGTLQTQVINIKEVQQKQSKQQCYLFCLYQIALKIYQANTLVSQEFNEQIFQVINICQCVDNQIQQLCAYLYCSMLQIKDVDQAEQLNQLLSQKSQANYTYLVLEILKKKLTGVQLQVQNLLMKVLSQMTTDVAKVIQLFQQIDPSLLKNVWVFLVFAISQSDKPIQITQFKILSGIILNYVRNGGVKDNYFNIIYQECRCRLQSKQFQILQLDFALEQDTEQTVTKAINLLLKKPSLKIAVFIDQLTDKYNMPSLVQPILSVLNNLFSNQRVHSTNEEMELRNLMKNIFIKVYNQPIAELLQLLQPYILDEVIPENQDRIPIHIKTRIFLLKRLQKLFKQCDTSNQVFDFLFKITTSIYEEAKEISFDMFQHFFYKEKDLLNFAAQIDSILCDTIRRENQNPPSVNLTNMKLISKFAKIVQDEFLATKLIQLLSKPLLNDGRKKLVPSQFFSEKSQLNILIQRIVSLGSIYRKIPNYFDQSLVDQLKCYVEELLEDIFVILCTPRSNVREYQSYNFVYNGKKYSYDQVFLHQSLPKLLRISNLDKPIHFTLIGYIITQYGAFEQNENMFKKTIESLTKERILQTRVYRIKGIQLLTEVINKNPQNQLLISGIQCLLPIISAEAPYSLVVCQQFYQTLIHHQIDLQLIVEPIIQIYQLTVDQNVKLNCLASLLKISQQNNQTLDQINIIFWDFLLTQDYDFMRCTQLIQFYKDKIYSIKFSGYIQTILQSISNTQKMRQEDYYLLLNLDGLINNKLDNQGYYLIIDKHFTNLLSISLSLIKQIKQNIQTILNCMLPAIYHKIVNKESETYLFIGKFLLLTYLLSNQKQLLFQTIFRMMDLFTDDTLDSSIIEASKQNLKIIVMNTQLNQMRLPDDLSEKVQIIYDDIQREIQEKQQREAKQRQPQQSGQIVLKMFG